jgi:hypothetical protein
LDEKYTLLFAIIIIALAIIIDQQILAQSYTYKPYYDNIINYCFDNADKILAGQNPVEDLLNAGLIPKNFANMTCTDVISQAVATP